MNVIIKKSLFVLIAVLCLSRVSQAEEPKEIIDPVTFKECINLPHGPMIQCIEKAVKEAMEKTVKKEETDNSEDAGDANPVPWDKHSLKDGKFIYTLNCSSCHGPAGHGDGPNAQYFSQKVADLTVPEIQKKTDAALMEHITSGGWPMPAFGYQDHLSEEDLWKAVQYIRSLAVTQEQ